MRKLKIEWEDLRTEESLPTFVSDKSQQQDWLEYACNRTKVVFIHSEFNPRTLETGDDSIREEELTEEEMKSDQLAKNLSGMIGNIVDYYVHPKTIETCKSESNHLFDFVTLNIEGVEIIAGFDEVLFTKRSNKEEPRVVTMNVYRYVYDEKVDFIEKAHLAAIPAKISLYGDSSSTESILDGCIEDFMADLMEVKKKPYHFYGTREVEVPLGYKGSYKILIEKDGSEKIM